MQCPDDWLALEPSLDRVLRGIRFAYKGMADSFV